MGYEYTALCGQWSRILAIENRIVWGDEYLDMAHDVVCPYHDFECAEGDKKLLAI